MSVSSFILPLKDRAATDPDRVGPKAANLAALAHAGLPTPGGFCITADAYHRQIQHLGLTDRAAPIPERRSADATPAVGRDQAEALSKRSRARPLGGHPRRVVGRAKARCGALFGADRGSRRYATSPASSKASSASTTTPNFSPRCAPAGRRCGPRTRAATWRSTISIRPTPPWRCWCSRWSPRALPAAV